MKTQYTAPGYRSLRKGRVSIPGHPYLITTICRHRQKRFASRAVAEAAVAALLDHKLWCDSTLLCWVLMPDHLHVLIELGGRETLPNVVRRMKCVTAYAANRADGRSESVWSAGYHDRALRRDEDVGATARYIIANPVRAGLVASPVDYPYWGTRWAGRDPDLG